MIKRPNIIFLVLIFVFVIVEILFLRPASIEVGEQANTSMFKSIDSMVQAQKANDEVGYTIDGFHYTAVEGELKHWELNAKHAVLYEKSKLTRSQKAIIKMFDQTGKITLIEGDEADYQMGTRDLEMRGNVKVTFPDGFWLKTERARYIAATGKIISEDPVYGEAVPDSKSSDLLFMWGTGFEASKFEPNVYIRSKARVKIRRIGSTSETDVRSDTARIDRFAKVAYFAMARPEAFVQSQQGTLFVKSKRQEATYDPEVSSMKYLTAFEQVLIKETAPKPGGFNYATSEKAEFLTQEDKIMLSGFPSAYQEHDTLTGELITIYRNKNLVEVSQANAFHDGTKEEHSREQNQQRHQRRAQ